MKKCRFLKHINRFLPAMLFLIFAVVFMFTGIYSHAASDSTSDGSFTTSSSNVIYQVNPLYKDIFDVSDLDHAQITPVSAQMILNADDKVESVAAVAESLKIGMKSRASDVVIYYSFPGTFTSKQLINYEYEAVKQAVTHTGDGSEGDYLSWGYTGYGMTVTYGSKDGRTEGAFKYHITYYTSAAQEAQVSAKAASISSKLGLAGKNDYEKILAVYKYICDSVKYNRENNNIKYSCYAAIINNSAVCQGYSLMAYRLLNDAGVDCRLVAGDTSSGAHGWNIVKIGSVYYNFDSTWDCGKSPEDYKYFLKCDKSFSDHKRWSDYNNATFNSMFPMSSSDYDTGKVGSRGKINGIKLSTDNLTLKEGDTKTIKCTYKPGGNTAEDIKWSTNGKKVATVDKDGVVTAVGAGTCIITAKTKDGSYSAECYVTVKPGKNVAVKKLVLSKKKVSIKKGKTYKLKVTFNPKNAKNPGLKFSSNNKKIATVSSKGVIKAKKKGTCVITVKTKDGKKSAKCKVTVK